MMMWYWAKSLDAEVSFSPATNIDKFTYTKNSNNQCTKDYTYLLTNIEHF